MSARVDSRIQIAALDGLNGVASQGQRKTSEGQVNLSGPVLGSEASSLRFLEGHFAEPQIGSGSPSIGTPIPSAAFAGTFSASVVGCLTH